MKKYFGKNISDDAAIKAFFSYRRPGSFFYEVPDYMRGGLARWVMWAIPPGDFLEAVLKNDLKNAAAQADDNNQRCLFQWSGVMYNDVPNDCQGSPEIVEQWKGILGRCTDCGQPLDVPGDEGSRVAVVGEEVKICFDCATEAVRSGDLTATIA